MRIASTSLLSNELKLLGIQGDDEVVGVSDGVFDGKDVSLDSFEQRSYEEVSGALHKSRGELDMKLVRDSEALFHTLLLPELVLLMISWTVFTFPLLPPFIMPRVATAMIAYMALTTLMFRTSSMLPSRGGSAWIDIFEGCSQILMFWIVCLNIFVEALHNEFGQAELARQINWEVRLFFPFALIVVYSIVFLFISSPDSLYTLEVFTQLVLFLGIFGYSGFCVFRFVKARKAKEDGSGSPAIQCRTQ